MVTLVKPRYAVNNHHPYFTWNRDGVSYGAILDVSADRRHLVWTVVTSESHTMELPIGMHDMPASVLNEYAGQNVVRVTARSWVTAHLD